ncbi:MAG: PDZ domain-containing protein [Myxococcales bacterium]|jgi:S1-C subfamily serine protease
MTDQVFQGLPVWHCFPGSISDRAGVRKGDTLLFANGVRVDSLDAYVEARSRNADALELTLLRGNELIEVTLDLRQSRAAA